MYAFCVFDCIFQTLHLNRLQAKPDEALPLLQRAVRIRTKELAEHHEDTVKTQKLLEHVQQQVRGQDTTADIE